MLMRKLADGKGKGVAHAWAACCRCAAGTVCCSAIAADCTLHAGRAKPAWCTALNDCPESWPSIALGLAAHRRSAQ